MIDQTCIECDIVFQRPIQGRPRLTCSPLCRAARMDRLRQERRASFGECEIEGCTKRKRSAGAAWCEMHYGRNRANGDPERVRVSRPYTGICYQCGEPAPRQRLFCDAICQRRDRMGAIGRISDCIICDGPLPEGAHLNTDYCSYECERAVIRAKLYGVEPRWLFQRTSSQKVCEVCGQPQPGGLFIDHDHVTGAYRGLLCANCNVGLGMFADDPQRLHDAAKYLEGRHGMGDEHKKAAPPRQLAEAPSRGLQDQGQELLHHQGRLSL